MAKVVIFPAIRLPVIVDSDPRTAGALRFVHILEDISGFCTIDERENIVDLAHPKLAFSPEA